MWKLSGVCLLSLALSMMPAYGETLLMGTSDGPPYMIQATETGLDIDIPRAALKAVGYDMKLQFYPLARAMRELQLDQIQLTAPFFSNPPNGIYVSDPHIEYRPIVVSMQGIDKIKDFTDLGRYKLATFQGAQGYFGESLVKAAEASPTYIEHHDMGKLVSLLIQGRTETVLLDYSIFNYYLNQSGYPEMHKKLVFHDFIPRVPATVAFHDLSLRDRFNEGLRLIRESGEYQQIIKRYTRFE